jgi:peptidoglycan/LPS O-acetylase OafA/YrhL
MATEEKRVAAGPGDPAAPDAPASDVPKVDHPADTHQPASRGHVHFPAFDGLRAIAAGAVLLHHAGFQTGYGPNRRFGQLLAHGDAGVSIFFLISGFLLYRPFIAAHLDDRKPTSADRFWWRRVLRIFPAYWVAVIVIYVAFGFAQGALHGPRDVLTYFGLFQIYDPRRFFNGINQAWSLSTEISFYLFIPFYAWAIRKVAQRLAGRVSKLRVEVIGLVVLYLTSIAWRVGWYLYDPYWQRYDVTRPQNLFPAPHAALATQYWLPSFLDLFAMGMGLALVSVWIVKRGVVPRVVAAIGRHPGLCWLAAACTYGIVCFAVGLPRDLTPLTGKQAMVRQLLYGLTAFFLLLPAVFGPQDRGLVRKFLCWAPMAYLGLISYGVYIWHEAWIAQVFKWFGYTVFDAPIIPVVLVGGALTILTASASYYLVERPALRFKDRPPWRRRRSPAPPPAVSAS